MIFPLRQQLRSLPEFSFSPPLSLSGRRRVGRLSWAAVVGGYWIFAARRRNSAQTMPVAMATFSDSVVRRSAG